MVYADIIVGYPVEGSFSYRVPPEMGVVPGQRVRVNFAGRTVTGFVVATGENAPAGVPPDRIKEVTGLIDEEPIFDARFVNLARFVAESYLCSVGEVMALALPSGSSASSRFRNPFGPPALREVSLNEEQERVHRDIAAAVGDGGRLHLLFGVTGSGKTEVYIREALDAMAEGKSVIYLVPEISLSSQIYERLHHVFGEELVLYHSRITAQQRLFNWGRFYRGEARIAVGTRSAVFMQAPRLGLIVVDEEHDGSYKEHSTPRYNARRIAAYRSRVEDLTVIMGSATPSVESLHAAKGGVMRLHRLTGRHGGAELPEIHIVPMESARKPDLLSPLLKIESRKAMERGEQVIYLLNRRGFAPVVICDDCGEVITCPDCSISLNFHQGDHLICHYCGYRTRIPERCRACDSEALTKLGVGTQRVEEVVRKNFSAARIFRLDQDSSRKKKTVYDLIDRMKSGEVDILLGTQMVAKGFDFHRVTVVGILLADIGMSLPDFRATERVYALLTQVSGRCGRGEKKGRVIVQTLNPDNPLFGYLKNHDYEGFYEYEISMRRALQYPPFARIARLLVRGKSEERVKEASESLSEKLKDTVRGLKLPVQVLGPSPAPLERIAANYRYHVILKSGQVEALRRAITESRDAVSARDVYLEVDMDPYDML